MDRRFKEGQYGAKFKWWQEPGFDEYVKELQQEPPKPDAPDFASRMYYDPDAQAITPERTDFPLFYDVTNRGLTIERTKIPAVQSVMPHVARDFDPAVFDLEVRAKRMNIQRGRGYDPTTYEEYGIEEPAKYLTTAEIEILSGEKTEWGRISPTTVDAIQEALISPELRRAHAEAIVELEDVREGIAKLVAESVGKPSSLDEPRRLIDLVDGAVPIPYD